MPPCPYHAPMRHAPMRLCASLHRLNEIQLVAVQIANRELPRPIEHVLDILLEHNRLPIVRLAGKRRAGGVELA